MHQNLGHRFNIVGVSRTRDKLNKYFWIDIGWILVECFGWILVELFGWILVEFFGWILVELFGWIFVEFFGWIFLDIGWIGTSETFLFSSHQ